MLINENKIKKIFSHTNKFRVFCGFDGYVDRIVKVVKSVNGTKKEYFGTVAEFSNYLSTKSAKSCSLEMDVKAIKIGGNMPIFANSMAMMGIGTDCVGAFGYPQPTPIFEQMHENCILHSVSTPGTCDALEFDDGKIMLAVNEGISNLNFSKILSVLPIEKLQVLTKQPDGFAFLNWSELPFSNDIWKGFADNILNEPSKQKPFLVDLSDCSCRTSDEISELFEILQTISQKFYLCLSLNQNETEQLSKKLGLSAGSLNDMAIAIAEKTKANFLVLHLADRAVGFFETEIFTVKKDLIQNPAVITGGGDNFNAGLMLGLLYKDICDFSICELLEFSNAVSSLYVKNGRSHDIESIIKFIGGDIL